MDTKTTSSHDQTNVILQREVVTLREQMQHKADKEMVIALKVGLEHSASKEDLDKAEAEMSDKIDKVDHKLDSVKSELLQGQQRNASEQSRALQAATSEHRQDNSVIQNDVGHIKNDVSNLQGGVSTLKWILMFSAAVISAVGGLLAVVIASNGI